MIKKKTKNKNNKIVKEKIPLSERLSLSAEIIHFIFAAILLFLTIFFIGSALNFSGKAGEWLFGNLSSFVGVGYYLFPLLFIFLSFSFFNNLKTEFTKIKFIFSGIFVISGLTLIELIFYKGGWLGFHLAQIQSLIGKGMSIIFTTLLVMISLVIIFNALPKIIRKKTQEYQDNLTNSEEEKINKIAKSVESSSVSEVSKNNENNKEEKKEDKKIKINFPIFNNAEDDSKRMADKMKERLNMFGDALVLPPVKLLSKDKGKPSAGDMKANANIIKNTLLSFGISVEMVDISVGPTVTRYSLKPARGMRLSKIAALQDDLALALAAKAILIQTPIPGESLVGIEIPNRDKTIVGAGTLFSSPEFDASNFMLPLGIGKDVAGKTRIIALEQTPHMLIAGATGAGKSVTVHAIVNSLLYKHGPDTLKLIMVDPKRVELTLYNGLPHLLTPVIVDPKKVILALRWAVNEMNRRYDVLENSKVRGISSYHSSIYQKAKDQNLDAEDMPEAMPYIVIIIDELADIMQQYPKELEAGIVSIAQKARAVGIHLILSTQRPSVNVVTGLIKANIPTRLALQVSSAIDSKTILDMAGAEKLLGKGDMLYLTGEMQKPIRVQSSYISENEVKAVVKFIKLAYKNELGETLDFSSDNRDKRAEEVKENYSNQAEMNLDSESLEEEDELLLAAKEEVIASGKASTSYLQRKLSIGYSRAAKIIDILEEKGIVGPANGSKAREVLIERDE